ncbi:MAG TPA: 2OG-Fe(II) oxygenase [Rhizomicrobium sp.]|nr:2OG-Fe(II) oxygenase [Rhizomicrobium sp.]
MSQSPANLFDAKSVPVNVDSPIPLTIWKDAFTAKEIDRIIAYGDKLEPMKAVLAGRSGNTDHLRITRVAWIQKEPEIQWLHARLEEMVLEVNARFYRYDLFGLNEAFQYTVYEGTEGGYYGWHVDVGEKNYEPRKISISVQLSDPSGYEGGDLILQAGAGEFSAEKARGTLIAFPSFVLHRVTPVTSGTRKSLVVWVAGPEFR